MKNRGAKLPLCALQVDGRWEGRKEHPCSASGGVGSVWGAPFGSAALPVLVLPVNRAVLSVQGVLQKKKLNDPHLPALSS